MTESRQIVLLSGGIDSAALAAWLRPVHTIFIDYGQLPAGAEAAAAAAIARELDLPHTQLSVNMSAIGAGILADGNPLPGAPSPEWWPFRNQLLVSLAAAWIVGHLPPTERQEEATRILTGSVSSDGARHKDGTAEFYQALDSLLASQEGGVAVSAPALAHTTADLVRLSGVTDAVLGWTHSCHRANIPCGECPGCYKRVEVLHELGRLE